jgi:hypothetical protein
MASPQNVLLWPMLDEYDNALRDAFRTVNDPDVRTKKFSDDSRPLRLNGQSSKYVTVYKMEDWVVKCFFTNTTSSPVIYPPEDISERYKSINSYINMHTQRLAFLVSQLWVENAVNIVGQVWPFIKSRFIQAPTLGEFLADRHQEPYVNAALAKQWLELIKVLESLSIAHGDLDLTNVLVTGTYPNITLRLLDFDSMYVPALEGRQMYELGHEHFQAPQQLKIRHFDSKMDRFPALVIYLSLIALNEDSRLWDKCKANEETKLLLGSEDFKDLGSSSAYRSLRMMQNNWELQVCLDELANSIYDRRTPKSLPEVLHSTPQMRVPTAKLAPLQSLPQYVAPPIGIVLPPEPAVRPQTQMPSMPIKPANTIPIPTSYLQAPAPDQPSPPDPTQPKRSKINPAVWVLLVLAILSVIIAIYWLYFWFVALALLIIMLIMLVVGMRKR